MLQKPSARQLGTPPDMLAHLESSQSKAIIVGERHTVPIRRFQLPRLPAWRPLTFALSLSAIGLAACESATDALDAGGALNCGDQYSAAESPLGLVAPFQEGTTWTVGGIGSFYGQYKHVDNDFYATDWNCCDYGDENKPVYPIAPGKVVYAQDSGSGYGHMVLIVHPGNPPYRSRYAHMNDITVQVGQVVFTTTQIGTVGKTGGNYGAHLHLSFQGWDPEKGNNGAFVSERENPASRKPSPMWAAVGATVREKTLCSGDSLMVTKSASVFYDVDARSWLSKYITSLYAHSYAVGCDNNPFLFCPRKTMTRAEMAVLIVRAYHRGVLGDEGFDEPPEPQDRLFVDVDPSAWYAKWVHQLYEDGFTSGCSVDELAFCPYRRVTKIELAVFMLRARYGPTFDPPPPQGIFTDLLVTNWRTRWAEAAFESGIMDACGANRFCPDYEPKRELIAAYMVRGFDLPLPPDP